MRRITAKCSPGPTSRTKIEHQMLPVERFLNCQVAQDKRLRI